MTGARPVMDLLVEALKRLEYRGYDSAGIATVNADGFERRRAEGKLENLAAALADAPLGGHCGIGHTRWATHGVPSVANAHPHATDKVAVVHNGIIENFSELKAELEAGGVVFASQTDTEVIPALITQYVAQGLAPKEAVFKALDRLEGAFALGIIFADAPDLLIAARRGSPLAIGVGEGEMFLGSDAVALAPLTQKICYLSEGDVAVLMPNSFDIFDENAQPVKREIKITALTGAAIGKGDYRHYMLKEIYEQPTVIGETLNVYAADGKIHLPELPFNLADISRIQLVACGTSFYAGLVARYWLAQQARIPVDIDIASEFRYRDPILDPKGLVIVISQSGETADTLAALRYAKQAGAPTLAVVNVPESSMAQEADAVLLTHAGPEIGVASTKAFTTQLTVLAVLALAVGQARATITDEKAASWLHALAEVPAKISEFLHQEEGIEALAHRLGHARDILYIGRGTSYAIAYEAALKMKEISYIHAEAYAAGEMKHGPIALLDEQMPVICIAPSDHWFDKTMSNVQEAAARGAQLIGIADAKGAKKLADVVPDVITVPAADPFVTPILYAVPVQLLAYHTAVIKGTDVDQPRNLAKSVTVE
jgi:glucosamine--fructose-6-phosphate aminotransferase (isomerizing)